MSVKCLLTCCVTFPKNTGKIEESCLCYAMMRVEKFLSIALKTCEKIENPLRHKIFHQPQSISGSC